MAGGAGQQSVPPAPPPPPPPHQRPARISPPKAVVDASPLQQAMDKNKESLKVKLMMRRPLTQLVAQGIMPPLKTPPAFHEQRKQLERAKTSDLLKVKIQKRPDRQELERRHILQQQEGHVDPSLAEKQRMLKKARLADQLNDQLSHRPGPLELIQKNILHTEEPIERAVKEGLVPFKATCEGSLRRPEHPSSYQSLEEDSPVEEGSPPLQLALSPPTALVVTSTPVQFHAVIPSPTISLADLCQTTLLPLAPSPVSITSSTSTLSPLSSAASPPASITPRPTPSPLHISSQIHIQRSDAPGKDKNRKKSKSKATPKARTIKFHEYKGPPNAHKSSSPPGMTAQGETSYELLLRQQQLFLQWQLESQHKYPQLILPAPHKHTHIAASPASSIAPDSPESSSSSHPHRIPTPPPPPPPPPGRLEDMKVSDLKAELKRRNLPVSGAKPHLIERLRPFITESHASNQIKDDHDKLSNSVESLNHSLQSPVTSPESQAEAMDVESQPPTPQSQGNSATLGEDIVREQQRKIEELQRELQKSQLQLQQIKAQAQGTRQEPPQDARHNRKLAIHHLQAKIQSHQLALHIQQLQELQALQGQNGATAERRQQEHREFQRRHSPGPTLPPPPPPSVQIQTATTPAPPAEVPRYVLSPKPVSDQLLQLITTQASGESVKMQFTLKDGLNGLNGLNGINGKNNVGLVLNGVKVVPITILPSNPPPQYEEATRNKPPPPPPPLPPPPQATSPTVKNQTVDDVLEILIKNGELPASAAQLPHHHLSDIINQSTDFLNQNALQNDQNLNQTINENDLITQNNLQDNVTEIINQNHLHDALIEQSIHDEFLNQSNSQNELLNQNSITNDLLNNDNMHNNLMNQRNILLNQHNSIHSELGNDASEHIDESSVLDDLINENSMDSVNQVSLQNSLISQGHNDFGHLSELTNNNHLTHIKLEKLPTHGHIFRDDDMSNDHHAHLVTDFDSLSNQRLIEENDNSNLFKSEILSDDCMSTHVPDNCEMDTHREHSQMDEGFNLEHLLGDDANDGLDLKELGLDLEGLDSMDFSQSDCTGTTHMTGGSEVMDMDEWLDSLWGTEGAPQCDPLLGGPPRASRSAPAPRPPPHFSWDKVDFATT
ncbi:myocardin-related transcription factor isoform X2 [Arctopsyche grandis]